MSQLQTTSNRTNTPRRCHFSSACPQHRGLLPTSLPNCAHSYSSPPKALCRSVGALLGGGTGCSCSSSLLGGSGFMMRRPPSGMRPRTGMLTGEASLLRGWAMHGVSARSGRRPRSSRRSLSRATSNDGVRSSALAGDFRPFRASVPVLCVRRCFENEQH